MVNHDEALARAPKPAWYTRCRLQQERWKGTTSTLPPPARANGRCWVESRRQRHLVGPFPVCLPVEHASLNLLPSIRDEALARFARHDIEWHGGRELPSSHLLDSQVQCVNVLLSLAREPVLLLEWVRTILPDARALVAIEDHRAVAFEWIGADDYLGEGRGRPRNRGRYVTSADALLVVETPRGRTALLVEWKYTEHDTRAKPWIGDGGTDRRAVYRPHLVRSDGPLEVRVPIEAYFDEVGYQLLRLQLLAAAIVRAEEHGIDRALVVHVVPRGNRTLREHVAPLVGAGPLVERWPSLLRDPGRVGYRCVDAEPLYSATPELAERYA